MWVSFDRESNLLADISVEQSAWAWSYQARLERKDECDLRVGWDNNAQCSAPLVP